MVILVKKEIEAITLRNKIRWITETAVLLALLIVAQAVTGSMSQYVTGSLVNCILAIAALFVGLSGGLTIALVSPWLAYQLGIASQIVTVPAIMLGNAVYVLLWAILGSRHAQNPLRQLPAWLLAAGAKFAVLYAAVVWLICGPLFPKLLGAGYVKAPMQAALQVKFSWPQLITALIGGAIAWAIVPALRKALKR